MDVVYIFEWWFVILILGAISFPFIFNVFKHFPDRGYPFSKIITLLLSSYIVWILGSLKIIKFSRIEIVVILTLLTLLSLAYSYKTKFIPRLINEQIFLRIFIEELLFLLLLVIWSLVRSYNPDIFQVEKFMDFGILNSLLRTDYFPPQDMWYSGALLNYYYYGQLITAVLVKLSSIPSNIAFNLMIAYVFAQSAASIVSIVFKFTKNYFFSIFSFVNLALIGNLDLAYQIVSTRSFDLNNINSTINTYYFAMATRVVPDSINEFPLYSFFLADLHAHFLDIPIVLCAIALIVEIYFTKNILSYLHPCIILLPLILGSIIPTNSWDFAVYAFLLLFVLIYKEWDKIKKFNTQFFKNVGLSLSLYISLVSSSFFLFIPFFVTFTPPVGGIGFNNISNTTFEQFIRMWGYFMPLAVIFLITFVIGKHKKFLNKDIFMLILIIIAILLILTPEFVFLKDIYFFRNPPYFRANTMFKLYFQAWILLSICSGYILYRVFTLKNKIKYLFLLIISLLLAGALLMPLNIITTKTNLLTYKGLDGTAYMKTQHPQTLEAINWINRNISGRPLMLEASGDSYTFFSRISANTGLPTIIGWAEHEWGWRYSDNEWNLISQRENDVKTVYTTTDKNTERKLLGEYDISYIYIGDLEKTTYPSIDITFLTSFGNIVYKNSEVIIIKINKKLI